MFGGIPSFSASQRSRQRSNPTRSRRYEAQCMSSISTFWMTSWKLPLRSTCASARSARSEEHTSELQSHSDLVCRLLLEKKKKKKQTQNQKTTKRYVIR